MNMVGSAMKHCLGRALDKREFLLIIGDNFG